VVGEQGGRLHALAEGVLRPRADWPLERRLAHLHEEVRRLLQSYAPDVVAIESVFHGVNTRSLVTLGQARGAILAALGARTGLLIELSPAEIKKSVTGGGRAGKAQVAHMLGVLFGPEWRARQAQSRHSADATDALGVALAGLHRSRALQAKGSGESVAESAGTTPAITAAARGVPRKPSSRAQRQALLRRLALRSEVVPGSSRLDPPRGG